MSKYFSPGISGGALALSAPSSPTYALGGEVLAWLSVCSEMQMICIWYRPVDATATPLSLAPVKSRMV